MILAMIHVCGIYKRFEKQQQDTGAAAKDGRDGPDGFALLVRDRGRRHGIEKGCRRELFALQGLNTDLPVGPRPCF